MSRKTRRHSVDPNLPALEISKNSVIPPNESKKNSSLNFKKLEKKKRSQKHM